MKLHLSAKHQTTDGCVTEVKLFKKNILNYTVRVYCSN